MKTNFKRLAAVVLALIMCVSTIVPAFAADATCPGKGKTHTVDNCAEEITNTVEATCSTDGKVTYKCTVCEDSFFAITPATEAHDYAEHRVDPTCTAEGSVTKTCTLCGDVKSEELDALGHSWTYTWKTAGKDDPCNRDVWTKRVCSVCGETEQPAGGQAAEGHKYVLTSVKTPSTCLTNGTAVYTCTECNKTVESALPKLTGGNHITDPADAFVSVKTAATCTAAAVSKFFCDECGLIETTDASRPAEHGPFTALTATAKSCTENQILEGDKKCNDCGKICKPDGTAYTNTELNARKAAHTYVKDANSDVAATCTTKAYWTETCTGCGDNKKVESTTAASHSWGSLVVVQDSTCTSKGYKAKVCSECDAEKDKQEIALKDHNITIIANVWENGVAGDAITVNYNAKTGAITSFDFEGRQDLCGKQYRLVVKCATCETKNSTTYPTFAAHSYEKKVDVAATCVAEGKYKMVCKCGKLDPEYVGDKVEKIPATGAHTYYTAEDYKNAGKVNIDGAVTPDELIGTYSSACGATNRVNQYCKVCGGAKKLDQAITLAHKYTADADRDEFGLPKTAANYQKLAGTGNCEIKAEYKEKCLLCGEFNKTVVLKKDDGTGKGHVKDTDTAHGYVAAAAATCTTPEKTEGYYCKNAFCTTNNYENGGAPVVASTTGKTLHQLNANKDNMTKHAAVAATCTTDGNIEYYTCVKGANCANYNSTDALAYTVDKDGNVKTKAQLKTNKFNHDSFSGATKLYDVDATCAAYGYEAMVCVICDAAVKTTAFTPAAPHVYGEAEESRSCETGHFTVKTCTVCGDTDIDPIVGFEEVGHYNANGELITNTCYSSVNLRLCAYCDEIIVKEAHAWGEFAVVENEKVRYCGTCGAEDRQPVLHEHTFGEWIEDDHAKHFRQCECGYEQVARHAWNDGEVTVEAAPGVEGVKTFTCTDCEATKTAAIPALPVVTDEPTTDEPTTDEPTTDEPTTDEPTTDEPTTDEPATDEPATDEPATDEPATDAPADEEGCGGSVSLMGLALVAALGACAVVAKKKED